MHVHVHVHVHVQFEDDLCADWVTGRPRKESCESAWEMLRNCESK